MAIVSAAGLFGEFEYLLFLALMASVSVVAITYFVARFLSDERMETYAKAEMSQIFVSVIILLVIVFAADIGSIGAARYADAIARLDPQAYGNPPICGVRVVGTGADAVPEPCHFSLASHYLERIFNTAKDMNAKLIWTNSLYMFISDISTGFRLTIAPWGDLGLQPFGGMRSITEGLSFAVDLLFKIMIATRFQEQILDMTWQALFPILLISGFFLRNFFITRRLGGLLLAIAAGMYFAYPFMYALAGHILVVSTGNTGDPLLYNLKVGEQMNPFAERNPDGSFKTEALPLESDYDLNTPVGFDMFKERLTPEEDSRNIFGRMVDIVKSLGDFIFVDIPGAFAKSFEVGTDKDWYLGSRGVFAAIAQLMLFTILLPFIALMATLSAIKVLSPMLGGDVEIAGLTRII